MLWARGVARWPSPCPAYLLHSPLLELGRSPLTVVWPLSLSYVTVKVQGLLAVLCLEIVSQPDF